MKKSANDCICLVRLSPFERHGFNALVRHLIPVKGIGLRDARKVLSGIRLQADSNAKVGRDKANAWIRRWSKKGLISRVGSHVRLGSIGIYSYLLDDDNRKLLLTVMA